MNLRNIANQATRAVNPNIAATVQVCAGYATDAAYAQVPTYAAPAPLTIQAQALTKGEIQHLDSLNVSKVDRAVYANLQLSAADRTTGVGGDLLTLEGAVYLVVAVLEGWTTAGWSKVALRKQMDAT